LKSVCITVVDFPGHIRPSLYLPQNFLWPADFTP